MFAHRNTFKFSMLKNVRCAPMCAPIEATAKEVEWLRYLIKQEYKAEWYALYPFPPLLCINGSSSQVH